MNLNHPNYFMGISPLIKETLDYLQFCISYNDQDSCHKMKNSSYIANLTDLIQFEQLYSHSPGESNCLVLQGQSQKKLKDFEAWEITHPLTGHTFIEHLLCAVQFQVLSKNLYHSGTLQEDLRYIGGHYFITLSTGLRHSQEPFDSLPPFGGVGQPFSPDTLSEVANGQMLKLRGRNKFGYKIEKFQRPPLGSHIHKK